MGRKRFDEYIRELRAQGKIPIVWSIADIRELLRGIFPDRTIGVFPNNYSASVDGRLKGDAVKRGMSPKYYRVGRGLFILVDEYNAEEFRKAPSVPIAPLAHRQERDISPQFSQKLDRLKTSFERTPSRAESIQKRLFETFPSKKDLIGYAGSCAEEYRRFSASYYLYQAVILRQRHSRIDALIADPDFHGLVYRTLVSWDMNFRNAKLVSFRKFSTGITEVSNKIRKLAAFSMSDLGDEQAPLVIADLGSLFGSLKVMESKSQIVGCSKALHFLLPRLVMPIDGKYTLKFLFGYRVNPPSLNDEVKLLSDIFQGFLKLSRRLGLSSADEREIGWNTTVPKIIDNAIIGYMRQQKRQTS